MKRVTLTLLPSDGRATHFVVLTWVALAGLAVLLLSAVAEYRTLELRLAEMSARDRDLSSLPSSAAPAEPELARAELLTGHAAVRFADWNATFAALGSALPAGVTVERVSLNARTGKGEAVVRMTRVADATRAAERLNSGKVPGASAVRRCDQSAARADAPVRCEIEIAWRGGAR